LTCKGVFTSMCRIIFGHAMIFLAIFLLCLVFTSCSQVQQTKDFITSKFSSDKEIDKVIEVVNEFFNMLMEKDYDSAYKYIYIDDEKNNTLDNFKKEMGNVTDIVSIDINSVEIKNNIALVEIDLIDYYDGEEKIYKDILVSLVKDENESWKIKFWN